MVNDHGRLAARAPSRDSQPRLLIVDDDVSLRNALKQILESCGFRIEIASSGRNAKAMFRNQYFHAVISDIRMPDGDGLDLLQYVRQSRSVPFFLMTGYAAYSGPDSPDEFGADQFLRKPFTRAELLTAVREFFPILDAPRTLKDDRHRPLLREAETLWMRKHPVLLIDDDSGFRGALAQRLETDGFLCRGAERLAEAVRMLSNQKFSVIVLDLALDKGVSGEQVLSFLRSGANVYNASTPVVVVSGGLNREDVRRLREQVSHIFVKPLDYKYFSAYLLLLLEELKEQVSS